MEIKGKVAIVTGGNSGIGHSTATYLAKEGMKVVIASRRENKNEKVAKQLRADYSTEVLTVATDVAKEADCVHLVEKTLNAFGQVDVLVNNAGIYETGAIEETSLETFDNALKTNLYGAFVCARESFKAMRKNRQEAGLRGYIVNISSVCGVQAWANQVTYCTSKFGMMGMNEALADEGKALGIKVTAICPAWVATPMVGSEYEIALKEAILPEDIAQTVMYCLCLSPNCWPDKIVLPRRNSS